MSSTVRGVSSSKPNMLARGRFRQTGPVWAGTTQVDGAYPLRDSGMTDTAELLATTGYDDTLISELISKGSNRVTEPAATGLPEQIRALIGKGSVP